MKDFSTVLLLFLLTGQIIGADSDTIPVVTAGVQGHYGFIIPHSESIRDLSHTNPFGIGLSYNKFHTSYDSWRIFNAFWFSGVEADYFNYANPEVLGHVFDIRIFAEPVLYPGKKYLLTVKGGGGVSYHTRIYDVVDNPRNLFFSSRFSFPLFVAARMKYRISSRTMFTISAYYNHISNGGYKQPNKGMNFPTLAIGLEHSETGIEIPGRKLYINNENALPAVHYTLQLLTTVRVMEENTDHPQKTCFVYGLHSRITKPLTLIYGLNAGAEIICDGYIRESLERNMIDLDYKRFALTAGQEFKFGKVGFIQYFGIYLYSPNKARGPVYQKYELEYSAFKKISLGLYLKAHAHVAESMGITISYII